ncbi:hypothetical protein [Nostoc sp.]|uniref:hypothetical protein n=1 Tax=Nostoc sp. TaxID=1180 RepID=UPI002FF6ABA4
MDRFISEIEGVTQSKELKERIQQAVPESQVELPKENSETSKKRAHPKKQSADSHD